MEDRRTDFEAAWPDVAIGLERALRRDGVAPDLCEDVVQETGLRLLRAWDRTDQARPLFPLALTIARRIVIDEARRRRPLPAPESVEVDAETAALARLEWARVRRALGALNPRHRGVLLAEIGLRPAADGTPAVKMVRARARANLRRALEQLSLVPPALQGRLRRFVHSLRVRTGDGTATALPSLAQAAAAAAIAVLGAAAGPFADQSALASPHTDAARIGATTRSVRSARAGDPSPAEAPASAAAREGGGAAYAPEPHPRSGPGSVNAKLPHSYGHGRSRGWFGPEGYHLRENGTAQAEGHDVEWRAENEYRAPSCIRDAYDLRPSTNCGDGETPRGYVEVTHNGESHRVEYGD